MYFQITKILTWIFVIITTLLALTGSLQAGAATNTPNLDAIRANNCDSAKTSLTLVNLFTPGNFFPVIPESCGGKIGEAPKALSLGAIPIILVRVYGLLASLVFYLFGFNLIFAAVRFSYGAFSSGEYEKSYNMIQEGFTSIALVVTAHIIVSTIFSAIFQIPLETDVTKVREFFT